MRSKMSSDRKKLYCSAYGCFNKSSSNPEMSFFLIPKDGERCLKWLKLIDREDLIGKIVCQRVCENHFRPSDLRVNNQRKLLKRKALPSLLLPEPEDQKHLRPADLNVNNQEKILHPSLPLPDLVQQKRETQTATVSTQTEEAVWTKQNISFETENIDWTEAGFLISPDCTVYIPNIFTKQDCIDLGVSSSVERELNNLEPTTVTTAQVQTDNVMETAIPEDIPSIILNTESLNYINTIQETGWNDVTTIRTDKEIESNNTTDTETLEDITRIILNSEIVDSNTIQETGWNDETTDMTTIRTDKEIELNNIAESATLEDITRIILNTEMVDSNTVPETGWNDETNYQKLTDVTNIRTDKEIDSNNITETAISENISRVILNTELVDTHTIQDTDFRDLTTAYATEKEIESNNISEKPISEDIPRVKIFKAGSFASNTIQDQETSETQLELDIFYRLCDKFLPKDFAKIVKAKTRLKNGLNNRHENEIEVLQPINTTNVMQNDETMDTSDSLDGTFGPLTTRSFNELWHDIITL